MTEQKEKLNTNFERKNLTFNAENIFDPKNVRWECKAKLGTLGYKGKPRLELFMESLGFDYDDIPEKGKGRFFPKKGGNRPSDLSYTLAVGACLLLGYDCVVQGSEIIINYF